MGGGNKVETWAEFEDLHMRSLSVRTNSSNDNVCSPDSESLRIDRQSFPSHLDTHFSLFFVHHVLQMVCMKRGRPTYLSYGRQSHSFATNRKTNFGGPGPAVVDSIMLY